MLALGGTAAAVIIVAVRMNRPSYAPRDMAQCVRAVLLEITIALPRALPASSGQKPRCKQRASNAGCGIPMDTASLSLADTSANRRC